MKFAATNAFRSKFGLFYEALIVSHYFGRFADGNAVRKRLLIRKNLLHLHVLKQWPIDLIRTLLRKAGGKAEGDEQESVATFS